MSEQAFRDLVSKIAARMGDRPLDDGLATFLNDTFPKDGDDFARLRALCAEGTAASSSVVR